MKLGHLRSRWSRRIPAALTAVLLVTAFATVGDGAAQAAQTSAVANTLNPHAAAAGHGAYHETITIPAGATVSAGAAGSARFSVSRPAGAEPQTVNCTLNVYPPFFAEGEDGDVIQATAEIACTGVVSTLDITVGIFQPYGPILCDNSNSASDTVLVDVITTCSYAAGYYYSTAVGSVNGSSFPSEVYSPETYIDY
jgi:hypothetical protein